MSLERERGTFSTKELKFEVVSWASQEEPLAKERKREREEEKKSTKNERESKDGQTEKSTVSSVPLTLAKTE